MNTHMMDQEQINKTLKGCVYSIEMPQKSILRHFYRVHTDYVLMGTQIPPFQSSIKVGLRLKTWTIDFNGRSNI